MKTWDELRSKLHWQSSTTYTIISRNKDDVIFSWRCFVCSCRWVSSGTLCSFLHRSKTCHLSLASDHSGAVKWRNSTRKNCDSKFVDFYSSMIIGVIWGARESGPPLLAAKCKILPSQHCKFFWREGGLCPGPNIDLIQWICLIAVLCVSSGFPNAHVCAVKLLIFNTRLLDKAPTQNGYASAVVSWSRFHCDRMGKLN